MPCICQMQIIIFMQIIVTFLNYLQWAEIGSKLEHYTSGDRLATWMFYLSDVEAGGRTAFPQAGISLAPVKGAAVFWYSIKKNGYGNQRSEHGGCPVLLGHKWVANKWIRENINFLRQTLCLRCRRIRWNLK
ncbi:hypothetical protein SK128_018857 [Halocaridina rubra]|uniref:Fe2OG dioxygenase domain-containing protein n=1 Tax=Halocaridina rubra TaxID=373956 RepID=A0AAN8XEN5_HALRR